MELSILDYVGLPEGSILSVRSGPTRRQSPLPCTAPFRLPPGPWPLRIDVLGLLGKSSNNAVLGDILEDGICKLPLEGKDGRQMSVTFQMGSRADGSPVKKRDAEADARAYLDAHRLHEFMHGLFELLLRERPEDPYAFMAKRFRQAAAMEAQTAEVRSTVSTMTPSSTSVSSMSPCRDLDFGEVPERGYKAIFQTMRGREVSRLVISPNEKVGAVKARLESLGSIQLFWLGEMLPNDTTLEDWFVEPGPVVLHVVCSHRDTSLRVLTGASEGLRLWQLQNSEQVKDIPLTTSVMAMAVDWAALRAVVVTLDGRLQTWDLSTSECSSVMAHAEEVCCLEVDWASHQAMTGSCDGSVKLWALQELRCCGLTSAPAAVDVLAVDWQRRRAYLGLRNGLVRLWDMDSHEVLGDFEQGAAAAAEAKTSVSGVCIDCVGRRAVSGFEDGHLAYWRLQGEEAPRSLKVMLCHFSALRSVAAQWRDAESRCLVGADDGSLSLWRLDSGECLARFVRHVGMVWAIHVDWAKERAVSGAFDGCFKLWDLRTGECLRTIQGHSRPIRSICCG